MASKERMACETASCQQNMDLSLPLLKIDENRTFCENKREIEDRKQKVCGQLLSPYPTVLSHFLPSYNLQISQFPHLLQLSSMHLITSAITSGLPMPLFYFGSQSLVLVLLISHKFCCFSSLLNKPSSCMGENSRRGSCGMFLFLFPRLHEGYLTS